MPQHEDSSRDPVCGMVVHADDNAVEYQQMNFAFCSMQCKERFLANPHLYIGNPGHKAPVQQGRAVLKRRRLKLDRPLTPEMAETVIEHVQAMMGIEHFEIDGNIASITYDLLQATEAQIEAEIGQAGAKLGHEWPEQLRRAFVHYLEETEIENLEVHPTQHGHGH